MTDSAARSTTRPFDSSTSFRISARFASVARILTSASSCATTGSEVTSWTFRTSVPAPARWCFPPRSLVRPFPLLDEVGQALAGGHHREDVLLLGDLEPDERRPVDRLGGADRVIDLAGLAGPEGRDPERVRELREVGAREMGGVVVAGVDDLLPLPDHPALLVVQERDLHRDLVRDERHHLLARHLEP